MNLPDAILNRQKEFDWHFSAAVFLNPEGAKRDCGWLSPDIIATEPLRVFWDRVQTGVSVAAAAREAGPTIHKELLDATHRLPDVAGALDYATAIAEHNYLFRIAQDLGATAGAVKAGNVQDVRRWLDRMAKADSPTVVTSRTSTESLEDFSDRLHRLTGRTMATHIPPVDRAMGGLERQTLTVIAARPGMGKSALSWQLARNIARAGKRAVFFSLEMSETALWARSVCGAAGVRWRDMLSGVATESQVQSVKEMALVESENLGGRLYVNDRPSTVASMWAEIANLKPDLVVVDHLRLVKDKADSEVRRLGWITERMKDAAKEFDCAVVLLAQLNRGVEMRQNKRPQLADLRDSGEIEENADTVLFMFREDYYDKEIHPMVSKTELDIAKFRNDAPSQSVILAFDLPRQHFETIDPAFSENGHEPVLDWVK